MPRTDFPTVICLTANSYGPGLAVFAFHRSPPSDTRFKQKHRPVTGVRLRTSNPDAGKAVCLLTQSFFANTLSVCKYFTHRISLR